MGWVGALELGRLRMAVSGEGRRKAWVLSQRTGQAEEREGHQLAVVAYRDGQLYCMCTEP